MAWRLLAVQGRQASHRDRRSWAAVLVLAAATQAPRVGSPDGAGAATIHRSANTPASRPPPAPKPPAENSRRNAGRARAAMLPTSEQKTRAGAKPSFELPGWLNSRPRQIVEPQRPGASRRAALHWQLPLRRDP